jgi:hypothetical protein
MYLQIRASNAMHHVWNAMVVLQTIVYLAILANSRMALLALSHVHQIYTLTL